MSEALSRYTLQLIDTVLFFLTPVPELNKVMMQTASETSASQSSLLKQLSSLESSTVLCCCRCPVPVQFVPLFV